MRVRGYVPIATLREIVDHVSSGLSVVDRQMRILLWNRFMESYSGRRAEDVIGLSLFDCFVELPRGWLEAKIRSVFLLGNNAYSSWQHRPYLFAFPLHGATGAERELMRQNCTFMPVFGQGGNVDAVCIAIDDATERSRYHAAIEQANHALRADLAAATQVQALLLPEKDTHVSLFYRLGGYYQPAKHAGGDWWWYEVRPDGQLLVFVGDVTGHGASSAMVAVAVATAFRELRDRPRLQQLAAVDVVKTIENMSRSLQRLSAGSYLMSMVSIQLSADCAEMHCWSAGAPPVLVLDRGGRVDALRAGGSMLGHEQLDLGSSKRELSPGDRVFMFTDGAYEFPTRTRRTFGLKRLLQLLADTRPLELTAAREMIGERLADERDQDEQDDDITFVLLDV